MGIGDLQEEPLDNRQLIFAADVSSRRVARFVPVWTLAHLSLPYLALSSSLQ